MRYITSWCLSSHGDLLGVLRSNFAIFQYTRRSSTREQRGAIIALYLVTPDIDILDFLDMFINLLIF